MFRADLLLILRRYYSVYTAIVIFSLVVSCQQPVNKTHDIYEGDPKSKVSIMLGLQGNCSRDCWPHCYVRWFTHSQTSRRSAR